jgi:hypothetical protein
MGSDSHPAERPRRRRRDGHFHDRVQARASCPQNHAATAARPADQHDARQELPGPDHGAAADVSKANPKGNPRGVAAALREFFARWAVLLQQLHGHHQALDLVGALVDLRDRRLPGSFRR